MAAMEVGATLALVFSGVRRGMGVVSEDENGSFLRNGRLYGSKASKLRAQTVFVASKSSWNTAAIQYHDFKVQTHRFRVVHG